MAQIAGAKPAVAKGTGVRLVVAVVSGTNPRSGHADLAGGHWRQVATGVVADGDLHPGPFAAAGADPRAGNILGLMFFCRQDGDATRHFAKAEVLHQHLAKLVQRHLLVGTIHRRTGIDHIPQGPMVVEVNRRILDQHLHDRRHGEHVGDAMPVDQLPGDGGVQSTGRHQHAGGTGGKLEQKVHPRAMRQRRDDQAAVAFGRAGDQVTKMVDDDKASWPCVSTTALGLPVEPEVKKCQQGVSRSTAASPTSVPRWRDTAAS